MEMSTLQTIRIRQVETALLPQSGNSVRNRTSELARQKQSLEAQMADHRREHDELRRTLFEAAQVQRKLCGPRQLRRESFEVAAELFPVRHLSGDFISVFEIGDDLLVAIGDIAGKGLPAAMWFTQLLGMVRLYCASHRDPAAVLSAMNASLLATALEAPLTTMFLARLHVPTGRVTYCVAGHPPALLVREDTAIVTLDEGGPPLGALSGAEYKSAHTGLGPGDILVGYSDGILEAHNPGCEEFGVTRLMEAVSSAASLSASGTLFSVLAAVESFTHHQPREDDFALVVVRRHASAAASAPSIRPQSATVRQPRFRKAGR
jgi:sigma-B regulation protein RsbU (phosphoserine phosphatase)